MILQFIESWFSGFGQVLPQLLPRWAVGWVIAFLILLYSFNWLKPRVRRHAIHFDEKMRAWSKTLRYKGGLENPIERVLLTWFFRFWTNFASAPSLGTLSFVLPIWKYAPLGSGVSAFHATEWWLLPGLCFAGSMGQSFVLKRIFRRLRPPREKGAFGHKMKDPSFPSGHSLTALCFWFSVAVASAMSGAPVAAVIAAVVWAVFVVGFTGLSRIYLGVHFPSDVVGGYIIAIVWSVVCFIALRPVL